MHTFFFYLGLLIRTVGILPGVGAVAGVLGKVFGFAEPSPEWWQIGTLFIASIVMAGGGMLLSDWALKHTSLIGKRILISTIVIPLGMALTWFGLGISGFFYQFPQLDPYDTFEMVTTHWIGYGLTFAGSLTILLGFSMAFKPPEDLTSIEVVGHIW